MNNFQVYNSTYITIDFLLDTEGVLFKTLLLTRFNFELIKESDVFSYTSYTVKIVIPGKNLPFKKPLKQYPIIYW